MNNEIKFYTKLISNTEYKNLSQHYFYTILRKYISNYINLEYEKCMYLNNFSKFKLNNKKLIETNLEGLIGILNSSVNLDVPFYKLKYFRAFEQNKLTVLLIIEKFFGINGEII